MVASHKCWRGGRRVQTAAPHLPHGIFTDDIESRDAGHALAGELVALSAIVAVVDALRHNTAAPLAANARSAVFCRIRLRASTR